MKQTIKGTLLAKHYGGTTRNGNSWYWVCIDSETMGYLLDKTAPDNPINYVLNEGMYGEWTFVMTSKGERVFRGFTKLTKE